MSLVLAGSTADTVGAALLALAVLVAAASDLRHRRISNRVNLAILVVGLGARAAAGGLSSLTGGLAGAALGLALLLPLFAARWIGGGDTKLMAALGAWLGPSAIAHASLYGLAGGGLVAAVIALRGGAALRAEVATNLTSAALTLRAPVAPVRARRHLVPMALPLGVAALVVFVRAGGF